MADITFNDFLVTIPEENQTFAALLNDYLLQNGCQCNIKSAKSGPAVSYVIKSTKKTLANFLCRKTGTKIRIYPQCLNEYEDFLNTLPDRMKQEITKASVCKRLLNPDDCNPKCVKGYEFLLDDIKYQKCRYMAFTLTLTPESNPYIKAFLEQDLRRQRAAD